MEYLCLCNFGSFLFSFSKEKFHVGGEEILGGSWVTERGKWIKSFILETCLFHGKNQCLFDGENQCKYDV